MNKPLKQLKFCGVHARVKQKNLLNPPIEKFQALFKGWLLRNTLKMSGPGVLNAKVRHNEDDLVTCDQVHPCDYFAFEEGGKIFWFDVRTIYQWSLQSLDPANPYTKQPLTIETRKRLKSLISRREIFNLPVYHPNFPDKKDRIRLLWILLIQILNENLFADIPESYFLELNEFQLCDLCYEIFRQVDSWKGTKHDFYYVWLDYCTSHIQLDFYSGFLPFLLTLVTILKNEKLQYDFSFIIMSARARL
jgi:hypothetical protein